MEVTIGVLSILEGDALIEARRLWKLFEVEYASRGVQTFAHPNLTFQAGVCDDVDSLGQALIALSQRVLPFEITIDGLTFFPSPSRVAYLRVTPTAALRQIHRAVSEILAAHCTELFHNYQPENWVPHVTVAMGDLTDENRARATRDLAGYHPA